MADKYGVNRKTFSQLMSMNYYEPKIEVAEHAHNMLWGTGYDIDIVKTGETESNSDMLDKLNAALKRTGFDEIISRNENSQSMNGYTINTMYLRSNGDLVIGEANPEYSSKVAKVEYNDDISAWVWKKFQWDDVAYTMIEKWDTKKVVRVLSVNGENVNLQGFNSKVPEEMRIKAEEIHNYGVLPVMLMTNKEKYLMNPSQMNELADDYAVRNVPYVINQAYNSKVREIMTDITQVFGHFSTQQIKKLKANGAKLSDELVKHLYVVVKQRGDNSNNKMVEKVVASLAQLEKLDGSIETDLKRYWGGCGYTYLSGDETLDTNSGALFANGKDIKTTKAKRTLRERQYSKMIKKILVVMNLVSKDEVDDYDIIFNIKENTVQSEEQIINNELQMFDSGLQSAAITLSRIRNLNIDTAEKQVEEAKKEQQERQEQELKTIEAMSTDNAASASKESPGQPKNGEPDVK